MKKESLGGRVNFYGLHLLLALVILVFSVSIADQFALPKYAVLQSGTLILFASWLYWSFSSSKVLVQRTSMETLVLFFTLIFVLSTVFSLNPMTSLLGKYHRYEGLLTQASYLLLFFLSLQLLNTSDAAWRHAKIMVLLAVLVSLYGLVQFAGFDVYNWRVETGSVAGQSMSTFGNRSFLGGFLVLALPLAVAWFFAARGKERWLSGLASMVIVITLVSTETRASWIGASVGLVFFALLSPRKIKLNRGKLSIAIALLAALVLFFSLFGSQYSTKIREISLRASGITLGSGAARLETWKSALRMIAERPLLGTGPDSFRLLFTKFQSVRYSQVTDWQSISDDAHNYFLNLGSTLGLLGFLAMASVLIALGWKGAKGAKGASTSGSLLYGGFLAGALSYEVHLSLSPGNLASTAWLWVIFGILSAHLFPYQKSGKFSLKARVVNFRWPILILVVAVVVAGTAFGASRYLADFYFARAEKNIEAGWVSDATGDFERAIRFAPYYSGYRDELALVYVRLSAQANDYDYLRKAEDIAGKSIQIDRHNIDGYMVLANVYLTGAEQFRRGEDATNALRVLREALRVKPQSSLTHFFLARTLLTQGKTKEAEAHLRKAIEIEPDYGSARKLLAEIEGGRVPRTNGKDRF